jgi:peroxiredoxin
VSHDTVAVHAAFAKRHHIAFTLLADEQVRIIEAFGLANPQYPKGSRWYGVALPAIFVISPDGVVTHRFSTTDYTDRPSAGSVLGVLQKDALG